MAASEYAVAAYHSTSSVLDSIFDRTFKIFSKSLGALTQTIGGLLQTEKALANSVEIGKMAKEQSRHVNSQTPIYPQGVVKSLDLIRSSDEDGLIHVSARIVMDIEELKVLGATIGGQNPTAPPPKAITEPEPPVNSKPSFNRL
jgi:hypothetical protein